MNDVQQALRRAVPPPVLCGDREQWRLSADLIKSILPVASRRRCVVVIRVKTDGACQVSLHADTDERLTRLSAGRSTEDEIHHLLCTFDARQFVLALVQFQGTTHPILTPL